MKTWIKILIGIGILVLIFLISFLGSNYYGNRGWYIDGRPECYFLTGTGCMSGYDLVEMQGSYWSLIPIKECCLKPHYLLQSEEPTLFTLKQFCERVIREPYFGHTYGCAEWEKDIEYYCDDMDNDGIESSDCIKNPCYENGTENGTKEFYYTYTTYSTNDSINEEGE